MEIPANPEQNQSAVREMESVKEVGDQLLAEVPGVVVFDLDFTLKPKEYELGMGGKEPGRMPDASMDLLKQLKDRGWRVLIVTNQPEEGHQVARIVRNIQGNRYPIFPTSVAEVVGRDNVFGAGPDFLTNKFKKSTRAVERTQHWVEENSQRVEGAVVFVGDRDTDVDFAQRVGGRLAPEISGKMIIYKVRGLSLPGNLKIFEKFVP